MDPRSPLPAPRRAPAALASVGILAVMLGVVGAATLPAALAAPDASSPVRISEVQVDDADWIELTNTGTEPVDVSGWVVRDDKDTDAWVVPDGTSIAPGAYFVIDGDGVPGGLTFGLGKKDQARVFLPDGTTAVDAVSWTSSPGTSWVVCGGALVASSAPTRGAANVCPAPSPTTDAPTTPAPTAPTTPAPTTPVPSTPAPTTPAPTDPAGAPLVINEIASQGTDFVELHNTGTTAVDAGGYVVKDSEDDHVFTIPAGTTVAPEGYLLLDALGFGLGNPDQARLFTPAGVLVSSLEWSDHVRPSLGLCDGLAVQQATATPGAANDCTAAPVDPVDPVEATPLDTVGEAFVADAPGEWPGDLSGLDLQGSGADQILWGVNNDTGQLSELRRDGGRGPWLQAQGRPTGGTQLRFADGSGEPDAEGVSVGEDGSVYVAAERDNTAKDSSRNTVLRYDATASGDELTATSQWDLTGVVPATAPNAGIEAVEIVPASAFEHLRAPGARAAAATPVAYAFVAVEATGDVHALELLPGGAVTLVATLDSPLAGLMALDYDEATRTLRAFCDEVCNGRSVRYDLSAADVTASGVIDRATGMPDVANEGVALAPSTVCTDGGREAWFADDADTDGHSIRGTLLAQDCPPTGEPGGGEGATPGTDPSATPSASGPAAGGTDDEPSPSSGSATVSAGDRTPEASTGTVTSARSGAQGDSSAQARQGSLPRTGLDVAPIALVALALIVAGGYLVRRGTARTGRG